MPQKILRLGLTECSLLFIYWLKNYKKFSNEELSNSKNNLTKWLYTTSGYYDKTQKGNYFNVIHETDPEVYNTYMETLLDFIKNSDIYDYKFHNFTLHNEINEFKNIVNAKKESHLKQEIVYDFIKDKKILIISPFSLLIKNQLDSGNCKFIYHETPSVQNISIYKFPYTFFNNGPHNNILETTNIIFNEIVDNIKDDYESVLISCGAYGCLLAKKFYDINKNVCIVGGDLQTFFGILNGRTKEWFEKNNIEIQHKDCWITNIPDEYKPNDYMKIENGCYW
jgi:hypothetical protein